MSDNKLMLCADAWGCPQPIIRVDFATSLTRALLTLISDSLETLLNVGGLLPAETAGQSFLV
jgi:hypothetical protein